MAFQRTRQRRLALLLILVFSPGSHCVQPLDDEYLEGFHLQGLDPPAAGGQVAAVDGEVSQQTKSQAEQDLADTDLTQDELSNQTASNEAPAVTNDERQSSQNFSSLQRQADVQITQKTSANRNTGEATTDGGRRITVNNEASYIRVHNIRDEPGVRLDPGAFEIQNIRVNSEVTVHPR